MTIYRRIAGVRRPRQGGVTTLVSDTFSRGSDTVTLGTADTGQVWANFGSGRYTITSGQANPFQSITNSDGTIINAGSANATVQWTQVDTPTVQVTGTVFRWVDASNYWLWWGNSTTAMRLSKFIAGVETVIGTDTVGAFAANVLYTVSADAANLITCKRNGVTIRTVTDAQHAAGTRFGFGGGGSTASLYDNFTVTTP